MDAQTISNIVLSSLLTLLVVISALIAVATLRQSSKMIESQSRPYIGVSSIKMNNGTPIFELVVKNYGAILTFPSPWILRAGIRSSAYVIDGVPIQAWDFSKAQTQRAHVGQGVNK